MQEDRPADKSVSEPDLKPKLDFPGASAHYLRQRRGALHFAARRDDGPTSMWWHFALEGLEGDPVECVWEHTEQVLGSSGLGAVVPVYRANGQWRRVAARSCNYDPEAREFRFQLPAVAERLELAYCYPYGLDRVEAMLKRLARRGHAHVREIGASEGGRPMQLVEMGHGDTHIWLTARHHAGETPGSYVLEGLLRQACRRPDLLDLVTLHAVPVMDLDGVAEGMYGKDRAPRDFNRDYVAEPCRPEVAALIQAAEWVKAAHLFIDLHAPAPGNASFVVPVCEPLAPAEHWERVCDFSRTVQVLAPTTCPIRVADISRNALNWYGDYLMQNSTSYFQSRFGALGMTLETSYHRAWNGRLVTPAGWQGLGRAVLDAIGVHVGLLPAPDVHDIPLPPPLIPRMHRWMCITWPPMDVSERRDCLQIVADEPVSGAVMHRPVFGGRGRHGQLMYRLQGEVEGVTVGIKGYDRHVGRPTGSIQNATFNLHPGTEWQPLECRHSQVEYMLLARVHGLRGRLQLRAVTVD